MVSAEHITHFIRRYPVLQIILSGMRRLVANMSKGGVKMKDMDTDVQILKEFFRVNIGRDWREASRPNKADGPPWLDVQAVGGGRKDDA